MLPRPTAQSTTLAPGRLQAVRRGELREVSRTTEQERAGRPECHRSYSQLTRPCGKIYDIFEGTSDTRPQDEEVSAVTRTVSSHLISSRLMCFHDARVRRTGALVSTVQRRRVPDSSETSTPVCRPVGKTWATRRPVPCGPVRPAVVRIARRGPDACLFHHCVGRYAPHNQLPGQPLARV